MSKLYDFLFLAAGGAPAAWAHDFMRVASRLVTGASSAPRERRCPAAPFPTDNRLRDDMGLPPLADDRPPPQPRLMPLAPTYFPTDDRLRDDIGLPPLGTGAGAAATNAALIGYFERPHRGRPDGKGGEFRAS